MIWRSMQWVFFYVQTLNSLLLCEQPCPGEKVSSSAIRSCTLWTIILFRNLSWWLPIGKSGVHREDIIPALHAGIFLSWYVHLQVRRKVTRQEGVIMLGQIIKWGWSSMWSKLSTGRSAKSGRGLKCKKKNVTMAGGSRETEAGQKRYCYELSLAFTGCFFFSHLKKFNSYSNSRCFGIVWMQEELFVHELTSRVHCWHGCLVKHQHLSPSWSLGVRGHTCLRWIKSPVKPRSSLSRNQELRR